MLQPYSKQEVTEKILLYLHLVVEFCARGASQRFLGWDITIPFHDIRKEISVLFGLIAEVRAHRKSPPWSSSSSWGRNFSAIDILFNLQLNVGMCFIFNLECYKHC